MDISTEIRLYFFPNMARMTPAEFKGWLLSRIRAGDTHVINVLRNPEGRAFLSQAIGDPGPNKSYYSRQYARDLHAAVGSALNLMQGLGHQLFPVPGIYSTSRAPERLAVKSTSTYSLPGYQYSRTQSANYQYYRRPTVLEQRRDVVTSGLRSAEVAGMLRRTGDTAYPGPGGHFREESYRRPLHQFIEQSLRSQSGPSRGADQRLPPIYQPPQVSGTPLLTPPAGMSRSEMQRWYREVYLQSQHWKDKRASILQEIERRTGRPARCAVCGSTSIDLHHLSYANRGKEAPTDFVPLCRTHHKKVEEYLKKYGLPTEYTPRAVASNFSDPGRFGDLAEVRMPIGKYKGRALGDLPSAYFAQVVSEMAWYKSKFPALYNALEHVSKQPWAEAKLRPYFDFKALGRYSPADSDRYRNDYGWPMKPFRPRLPDKDLWMEGKGVRISGEEWQKISADVRVMDYGRPAQSQRRRSYGAREFRQGTVPYTKSRLEVPYGRIDSSIGQTSPLQPLTPYTTLDNETIYRRAQSKITDYRYRRKERRVNRQPNFDAYRDKLLGDFYEMYGGQAGEKRVNFKWTRDAAGNLVKIRLPPGQTRSYTGMYGAFRHLIDSSYTFETDEQLQEKVLRITKLPKEDWEYKFGGVRGVFESTTRELRKRQMWRHYKAYTQGFFEGMAEVQKTAEAEADIGLALEAMSRGTPKYHPERFETAGMPGTPGEHYPKELRYKFGEEYATGQQYSGEFIGTKYSAADPMPEEYRGVETGFGMGTGGGRKRGVKKTDAFEETPWDRDDADLSSLEEKIGPYEGGFQVQEEIDISDEAIGDKILGAQSHEHLDQILASIPNLDKRTTEAGDTSLRDLINLKRNSLTAAS